MRNRVVKSKKFHGVFLHFSNIREDDECYYIKFSDRNGRCYHERVGWKNEGYTEEEAANIRAARIHEIRHGKELPVPKPELLDTNPTKTSLLGGDQFKEHTDQISRLLFEMKLGWLEPYIYTAMGLFKGLEHPKVRDAEKSAENGGGQHSQSLSNGEAMSLQAFKAGIELCRQLLFRELRVQELYMLLLAIDNEGIGLKDFQELVGLPTATVSRNVRKLGFTMEQGLDGKWKDTGYELVNVIRCPNDRRIKRLYLTEKGKQFAVKLKQTLSTGQVPSNSMLVPEAG